MSKKKKIARSNLPVKFPIQLTVVVALALDYWNAPEWLIGAVSLLMVFLWIGVIKEVWEKEDVDLLNNDKP